MRKIRTGFRSSYQFEPKRNIEEESSEKQWLTEPEDDEFMVLERNQMESEEWCRFSNCQKKGYSSVSVCCTEHDEKNYSRLQVR